MSARSKPIKQAQPKKQRIITAHTVEAQSFRMLDSDGKERASLFIDGGIAMFALYDKDKEPRLVLSVMPNGWALISAPYRNDDDTLDDTFRLIITTGFFRRVKAGEKPGYPRFRSRSRYNSFTYSQTGFAIKHGKLKLFKISKVKIKLHRPIEGKIKTLTIARTPTGKWYACFSVECEPQPMPIVSSATGVDCGLKQFAVLSNGEAIANPRFLRTEETEPNYKGQF